MQTPIVAGLRLQPVPHIHTLLAVLLILLALPVAASPIQVLTLDDSRIGSQSNTNGTINWNFTSGEGYQDVRDELLDTANFGPGGTVSRSVTIASTPALNSFAIGGADIILLNALYDFSFEDCELCVIESFVRQGGGLLVFANSAAERFAPMVGATTTPGDSNPSGGEITGATSPVLQGPFGHLAATTGVSLGFNYLFETLPSTATPLVESADGVNAGEVIGAAFTLDLGRVVLINDEELFFGGPGVNGLGAAALSDASTTLFLNSIAYLAPDAGFSYRPDPGCNCSPIPEPYPLALIGLGLVVGAFARRHVF